MTITTETFYGNANMYAFIPQSVFDKLERAFITGVSKCEITDVEYNEIKYRWQAITQKCIDR